jgi:hypothetical protein
LKNKHAGKYVLALFCGVKQELVGRSLNLLAVLIVTERSGIAKQLILKNMERITLRKLWQGF